MNQQPKTQIDEIARHDLDETFVDSIAKISFDGQSWRFDFSVTRLDPPKAGGGVVKGTRVPACRLVMTPVAGFDFATKMAVLMGQLEAQGVIQKTPIMPAAPAGSKPN